MSAPSYLFLAGNHGTLRDEFLAAIEDSHLEFFGGLRTSYEEGGYLFVHAGVRPGVPFDQQREHDLLWIREEFLCSEAGHGRRVVHGHTLVSEPEVRANRIGIDTGAYMSERLTALVLEGERVRFLST